MLLPLASRKEPARQKPKEVKDHVFHLHLFGSALQHNTEQQEA